jgi:hypothetical protein
MRRHTPLKPIAVLAGILILAAGCAGAPAGTGVQPHVSEGVLAEIGTEAGGSSSVL